MTVPELAICTGCCLEIGGDAVLTTARGAARGVRIRDEECLDVCGDLPAIGVGERRALVGDPEAVIGVIEALSAGYPADLAAEGLEEVLPA